MGRHGVWSKAFCTHVIDGDGSAQQQPPKPSGVSARPDLSATARADQPKPHVQGPAETETGRAV